MNNIPANRIVAIYLVVQSICILAWWLVLWRVPSASVFFLPSGAPPQQLKDFWLPDLLMLGVGSVVTAEAAFRMRRWAGAAVWALAAVCWYPALYCVAVSVRSDEAWIASAMMACMAGTTLAMATIFGAAGQTPAVVRVTPMDPRSALIWTLTQTALFWGVFLWVLPKGIEELESAFGLEAFQHAGQQLAAASLFGIASAVGLWSGVVMAIRGDGTPLPTATAPILVQRGPYRFVRNPMAVAGISQAVAVGWFLGSVGVILYALLGAVVWHAFVRPVEEQDLRRRFGASYLDYQQRVWLWVPRWPS